MLECK